MPTATDDLALLIEELTGGLVSVGKMSPDAADVHSPGSGARLVRVKRRSASKRDPETPRQRKERRVAQASNAVGLAAGAQALYAAGTSPMLRAKVGTPVGGSTPKLLTRRGKQAAIGATTLQAVNFGGDVITARVLGRNDRKQVKAARDSVEKVKIPNALRGLVDGHIGSARRVIGDVAERTATRAKAPYKPPTHASGSRVMEGGNVPINRGERVQIGNDPQRYKADQMSMFDTAGNPSSQTANQQRTEQRARTAAKPVAGALRRIKARPKESAIVGGGVAGAYGVHRVRDNRRMGQQQMGYMPYYGGKRAPDEVTFGGTFSKFDDDKRLAFGWASVVELNGQPVVDRQGDYIALEDIENAAYVYVKKSRVGGDMHRRTRDEFGKDVPHKVGELVESVVFTPEKCEAMGISKALAGKWWIGMHVEDDDAWQEVKLGKRAGFSIHGKGLRKDISYDSLMERKAA